MNIKHALSFVKPVILVKMFKKKIPLFLSWQITKRCNLRCKYCDYWDGLEGNELSTKQACGVIDQLAALGTLGISFTGGEPLLRSDIGRLINYAKQKGIISKINTNGLLIPQKIDDIQYAEQINLSFDGQETIHDQVRGAGSYKALFRAVDILKINKKKVVFHVTLTKYNLFSVDFILDKCREFNVGAFFQPVTELFLNDRNKINPLAPDKESYVNVIRLLCRGKKRQKNYICNSMSGLQHLANWPNKKYIYCSAGRMTFRLNSQGELYNCERFPYKCSINCLNEGVKSALDKLQLRTCGDCWCGPLVEMNLLMDFKIDSFLNIFKI